MTTTSAGCRRPASTSTTTSGAAAEDRSQHPTDDLTSMVVNENDRSPEAMSRDVPDDEVYQLLVVGGADTSDAAMSRMLEDLATHPETYERLRREPDKIPNYIEGMLRVAGPAVSASSVVPRRTCRWARKPSTPGSFVWLSSAGREAPQQGRARARHRRRGRPRRGADSSPPHVRLGCAPVRRRAARTTGDEDRPRGDHAALLRGGAGRLATTTRPRTARAICSTVRRRSG